MRYTCDYCDQHCVLDVFGGDDFTIVPEHCVYDGDKERVHWIKEEEE